MAIYHQFDEIPAEFSTMLEHAARHSLFLSKDWFENYIDTVVGGEKELRILAASAGSSDDSKLVLPMQDDGSAGPLSLRELHALANYYASRFEPLLAVTSNVPEEAVASLVAEISASAPRWDVVDVSPYASDSPVMRSMVDAFRESKWAVQVYECFKNLYLENEYDDFASYLKTRSSRIRKTAANRTRAFDRDSANSFRIVTSPDEVDVALKVFADLYEKRWGKSEPYPRFLPGLAKLCAERGWLRMGFAEVDGKPAAVQFWIVKDRVAYIYKVAYDEQYTKMSVGNVALFKMFEHVLDGEDVREIDFLTGDDAYKKDWMSHSREMMGMRAFNKRTLRGIASACRHIGGRMIKSRIGR